MVAEKTKFQRRKGPNKNPKYFKNKRHIRKLNEKTELETIQQKYETIDPESVQRFKDFPLCSRTLRGLQESGYSEPTDIQKQSIGLGLQGRDVLGAAQTGSGKTLAFLIPILECLAVNKWSNLDGLGALVITPTRELAYQIFETLKKVGKYHDFSAALIIGGKDLKFERKRMDQCNIIIGTPGRVLQHMDESPIFNCDNMQILVLDEADRCLDMGFEETMNNIVANLPATRQTLLFSATQTKSVRDLARLSLKDPMYVSVHEHAKYSTPENLQQSYMVCELHDKLTVLWSFIKNHTNHKILVFFSTCKQVTYFYDIFCKMRPGISVHCLHGSMHQLRRMAIYDNFCQRSQIVLLATDVAARGLDFPSVNWVVQYDCPEDTDTYIHRVGRTARFKKGGEALLLLLPSEETAMIEQLEAKRIPITKIDVNPNMLRPPTKKLQYLLAANVELKQKAQRAFIAYVKSVYMEKNKKVFDINALDTNAFSESLGLAIPPRIRFLKNKLKQNEKEFKNKELDMPESSQSNENKLLTEKLVASSSGTNKYDSDNASDDDNDDDVDFSQRSKDENDTWQGDGVSDDDDDGLLQIRRKDHNLDSIASTVTIEEPESLQSAKSKKVITKAALVKKLIRKNIVANKKILFDEEGEAIVNQQREKLSNIGKEYDTEDVGGIDIEKAKLALQEEDKFDKQMFREKVKAKHRENKLKMKRGKKARGKEDDEISEAYSGSGNESENDSGPDLSWLPDPDKIYGKENASNEDDKEEDSNISEAEESSSEDSEAEVQISKNTNNRKRTIENREHKNKKKKLEESSAVPATSLVDDEELALYFLKH